MHWMLDTGYWKEFKVLPDLLFPARLCHSRQNCLSGWQAGLSFILYSRTR
jgi:hypothetical protein